MRQIREIGGFPVGRHGPAAIVCRDFHTTSGGNVLHRFARDLNDSLPLRYPNG